MNKFKLQMVVSGESKIKEVEATHYEYQEKMGLVHFLDDSGNVVYTIKSSYILDICSSRPMEVKYPKLNYEYFKKKVANKV